MNLPLELVSKIIEHFVEDFGFVRATRLRLICKLFAEEAMRAICSSTIDDIFSGWTPARYMSDPFLSRWLLETTKKFRGTPDVVMLKEIRQTAEYLLKIDGKGRSRARKLQYIEALCSATAAQVGPYWVFGATSKVAHGQPRSFSLVRKKRNLHNGLVAAAYLGDVSLIKALLASGVYVKPIYSQFDVNPLQVAAYRGYDDIVRLLKQHGLDVTHSGLEDRGSHAGTTLQATALEGHEHTIRLLLEPEYGIDKSGSKYDKAIIAAAEGGHTGIVRILLENGKFDSPAVTSLDKPDPQKPLPKTKVVTVVSVPNTLSFMQYAAFFKAAQHGRKDLVEMLLDEGLDVNAGPNSDGRSMHDSDRRTALQYAADGGYASVVRLLLARGADAKSFVKNYRDRPLFEVASRGHEEVVQMLLDHGADVTEMQHIIRKYTELRERANIV